jgi:general secretion pathway protein D
MMLALALAVNAQAAERLPLPVPPIPKGATLLSQTIGDKSNVAKFDLQGTSVSQVITLVYMEAFKQAYVIDPAVLRDDRIVSFRFDASKGDIRQFWIDFLDSLGFAIESRKGVDFVTVKKAEEKAEKAERELEVFVYRAQYRPLSYLVGLLSPLFKVGNFTVNRVVHPPVATALIGASSSPGGAPNSPPLVPPGSAAATIDTDSDTMIFQGMHEEIAKLKKLLPQVDTPTGEVAVKAVVYEVTTDENAGTAFSLALNILGSKLGVNVGAPGALSNSISLKTSSIEAAFSALSGDSRFKAVSTPILRVKSGSQARLMVGQDVPTLGAVSYPQGGGQAVQSVAYQSSGVILSLTPQVREAGIDVQIDQQMSDFVKTESGVNNSPTLTKRSLSTTVTAADGELIVLGGLTQDKNSNSSSGLPFFPKFMRTTGDATSRTEILLLLQVSKLDKR